MIGGVKRGKPLEILAVRRLIKFSVFLTRYFRTIRKVRNPKKNRTFVVRCIFWWESACINRAENKTEFTKLMHNIKLYKEKWL